MYNSKSLVQKKISSIYNYLHNDKINSIKVNNETLNLYLSVISGSNRIVKNRDRVIKNYSSDSHN